MQSVTRYQKNALHSTNPSTRTLSNTVIWFVGLCGRVARVANIRLVSFSNTSWIPIINHPGKNSPVEPGWIRFPVSVLKLYLRCYFLSSSCLSSLYYSKSTKRDCRECPKSRFAKEIFALMEMENREGKFKTDFWASLNIIDLKIESFRHFPRTANVKKSREQGLAVRFAVWGSHLYG